ncbi:hypothetical protein Q1695_003722 [Nippostrongylus brasiliensis]|nr:hypothetical protein Q1695_003722 [Nippostrongylus brasiliensis]
MINSLIKDQIPHVLAVGKSRNTLVLVYIELPAVVSSELRHSRYEGKLCVEHWCHNCNITVGRNGCLRKFSTSGRLHDSEQKEEEEKKALCK